MKRKIFFLVNVLIFYFFGALTYRNQLFPFSLIRKIKEPFPPKDLYIKPPVAPSFINMNIRPYVSGVHLYSDRTYFDTIGDEKLDSSFVLQLSRHTNQGIKIRVLRRSLIIRLLSSMNDNNRFKLYKKMDINVFVRGNSCIHSEVVSKIFEPGEYTLIPGGPIASNPVIIRDLVKKTSSSPVILVK